MSASELHSDAAGAVRESAASAVPDRRERLPHAGPGAARQRLVIVGGAALVIIAIVWLIRTPAADYRPLQPGRTFSPAELRRAERHLRSAGLTDFRSQGQRLLVPALQLAQYEEAVAALDRQSPPQSQRSGSSVLEALSSARHQEQVREAARAEHLSHLLAQLPEIERAEVLWDEEPRIGWRSPPRVRATVFLKPRPGRLIGLDTVQAVRTAVAGSKAYLDVADVAVMDLERMVTYGGGSSHGATDDQTRLAQWTAICRDRVEQALLGIDGVRIAVLIAAGAAESATAESAGRTQLQTARPAAAPRSFTGISGPNMRLEVEQRFEPPAAGSTATGRQAAEASGDHWQFRDHAARHGTDVAEVVVFVPQAYLEQRVCALWQGDGSAQPAEWERLVHDVRRQVEDEIRERAAPALAELAATQLSSRITVRMEPGVLTPPVRATGTWGFALPGIPAAGRSLGDAQFARWLLISAAAVLAMLGARHAAARLVRRVADSGRRTAKRRDRAAAGDGRPVEWRAVGSVVNTSAVQRRATGPLFPPHIGVERWAPLVAAESLDVVAMLLPQFNPNEVAAVMALLAPAEQREVLELAASSEPDAARLEGALQRIRTVLNSQPAFARSEASAATAAIEAPTGAAPVERPRFGGHRDPLSSFDDLADLSDQSLGLLSRRIDPDVWSAALLGASPKLRRRVSRLRDRNGVSILPQHSRPVRLRDIEDAQRQIVEQWREQSATPARSR